MASFFNKNQIDKIVNFAIDAGKIAVESFEKKDFSVTKKPDGSKVTSADIAVSEFLGKMLRKEFPNIPIICEEGDLRDISSDSFFLIDPIDGTSSFVSGSVEFAINIAVVKGDKAVFGLIYAPLFKDGKMVFTDEKSQVTLVSGDPSQQKPTALVKSDVCIQEKLNIITSARSKEEDVLTYVKKFYPEMVDDYAVTKISSAAKFIQLLEFPSSIYVHFRPSMEWDTAAGQALVEVMGGKVKKISFNQGKFVVGSGLEYKKKAYANCPFVASINSISGGVNNG